MAVGKKGFQKNNKVSNGRPKGSKNRVCLKAVKFFDFAEYTDEKKVKTVVNALFNNAKLGDTKAQLGYLEYVFCKAKDVFADDMMKELEQLKEIILTQNPHLRSE